MGLKSLIDSFPAAGRAFRDLRDRRGEAALTLRSMHGFSLWGGNYLAAGFHEEAETEIVAELLREADILVDVGANSGLFACLSASRGIQCIALEPMPANLRILLRNIRHNGFEHLIEALPVAASDEIGVLPFFGRGQGASLVAGWGGAPDFDRLLVPTNTLDNLLADRLTGKRVVLKIDVEGAELRVLNGARKLLGSRPPILLEASLTRNHPDGFNPDFSRIFETLWSLGYSAYVADGERSLVSAENLATWCVGRQSDAGTENFLFRVDEVSNP